MDSYFEVSKARVRPVARVQMSVLSPEEIVSIVGHCTVEKRVSHGREAAAKSPIGNVHDRSADPRHHTVRIMMPPMRMTSSRSHFLTNFLPIVNHRAAPHVRDAGDHRGPTAHPGGYLQA
jgi:hypothetical protein